LVVRSQSDDGSIEVRARGAEAGVNGVRVGVHGRRNVSDGHLFEVRKDEDLASLFAHPIEHGMKRAHGLCCGQRLVWARRCVREKVDVVAYAPSAAEVAWLAT
jgi:hypothetical protein